MKKIIESNFRIEVNTRQNMWNHTPEWQAEICKAIKEQIERHVDDIGYVNILWDIDEVCSFCGYTWDEDEHGIPCCCNDAKHEWAENNPEKAYLLMNKAMKKYEYRIIDLDYFPEKKESEELLTRLGSWGWRVIKMFDKEPYRNSADSFFFRVIMEREIIEQ